MDKRPNIDKDVQEVEYVEAEVIEPSTPRQFEQRSTPYIRTYSSGTNCAPCCGPFGCILTLLAGSYLFFEFEFFRAVVIAAVIFVVVSILAASLTRGTR